MAEIEFTDIRHYDIGDQVKLSVLFKDEDGVLTDPSVVEFMVRNPITGIVTSYEYPTDPEVIRNSVGDFKTYVVIDNSGKWPYRVEGRGALIAAGKHWFVVDEDEDFYSGI